MKENERVKQFFDSNVADYEVKHYAAAAHNFMTTRQRRVLEYVDTLNLTVDSVVLDAGCGPGYLLAELAQRGPAVQGLDISPEMLRSAGERLQHVAPQERYSLAVGSIEDLPFPSNSFDLVCSTGVIEYLENDERVLNEMFRVLKPGGFLLLPVTNSLSPINCFEFMIEAVKRIGWLRRSANGILRLLGQGELLPRSFTVRRHRPSYFRKSLSNSGFMVLDDVYFHFLPWPRPFDRLIPKVSGALGNRLERFGKSKLGFLAEGYLALCKKTQPGGNVG